MIKPVNKCALLAIGLMLFAAGASASPILTYDAGHTLVTGVKNLSIGGRNYNATFLGEQITYNQFFSSRTPAFLGHQALAKQASLEIIDALNSAASLPALLADVTELHGKNSLWQVFLVPYDIYSHNGTQLPIVWYVPIHLASSNFWAIDPPLDHQLLFPITESAIKTSVGMTYVAFTDPPPAVPAPPTLALMAAGVLALTRVGSRRRARVPARPRLMNPG